MTTSAASVADKRDDRQDKEKQEKRRALGRGLESLLPGPRVVSPEPRGQNPEAARASSPPQAETLREAVPFPASAHPAQEVAAESRGQQILNLALDAIDKNPYQTRYVFEESQLNELRDSIKEHGVVQPIVVRPGSQEGRYTLVLGERRLRASQLAGKDSILALVRVLSPQQAAEMTLLENVVRQDLNPIEQAEAYRVLSQEFKLTQAQIAERIGVSRESVANYMRLLRLPKEVMQYMVEGRLTFSEAREILSLDHPEHIRQLADEVMEKQFKLSQIQERVRELNEGMVPSDRAEQQVGRGRWVDPNVRAAQTEMERTLGMRVRISDRNGKGKIVIEYASVDDYERVVEKLRA